MFDGNNVSNSGEIGNIGNLLYGILSQNPANSAMNYYNKIPGMLGNIFNPYMQEGMNAVNPFLQNNPWAINNYQNQTSNLINNPAGMMNQIGSTFQRSPGYDWQRNQNLEAVNSAAAAGGMAGSPLQQQNAANISNQFANQDYYNYLNHAMNMYNTGYQGLSNMFNTGANMANNIYGVGGNLAGQYASDLASSMMNQGNLSYLSGINSNQGLGSMIGSVESLASDFL